MESGPKTKTADYAPGESALRACLAHCRPDQIEGPDPGQSGVIARLAQLDVSKLLRGHFAGYTYDRLFGYLNALGEKVSIEVSEAKTKKEARLELEMTD